MAVMCIVVRLRKGKDDPHARVARAELRFGQPNWFCSTKLNRSKDEEER
jgi:hypothetical protein